jgi:glycosyltransferase involved in cell wall biosynthesis
VEAGRERMDTRLSVVVPAFNEEGYLAATLEHLRAAGALLVSRGGSETEIIVVDNGSTDRTAAVALQHGARVVNEAVHNVGRVRNAGAHASQGDAIVFLDADTLLPPHALARIEEEMRDPRCAGGALDLLYRPRRRVMSWYLGGWRWIGKLAGIAMGSGQFCRRDIFTELGGYDETIFMGEDVDFFWRLRRLARRRALRVPVLRDVVVSPSSRRFDQWPLWRVLVWTNPFFALPLRRRREAWSGWYTNPVR